MDLASSGGTAEFEERSRFACGRGILGASILKTCGAFCFPVKIEKAINAEAEIINSPSDKSA